MSTITLIEDAPDPAQLFGLQEVLTAMRAVVAEFGEDYLYKAPGLSYGDTICVYAEPDPNDKAKLVPSCLIAHVLVRLGIPLEAFAGMCGSISCIEWDLRGQGYGFTSEAVAAMGRAQAIQDSAADPRCVETDEHKSKCTWGAALRAAENSGKETSNDGNHQDD